MSTKLTLRERLASFTERFGPVVENALANLVTDQRKDAVDARALAVQLRDKPNTQRLGEGQVVVAPTAAGMTELAEIFERGAATAEAALEAFTELEDEAGR